MVLSNKNTVIWLNHIGISNRGIELLIEDISDVSKLWDMENEEILKINGIHKSVKDKILENRREETLDKVLEKINLLNVKAITSYDDYYPRKLLDIPDKPNVLYCKGIELNDIGSIGIVGSRKTTDYGKWACREFARELSKSGVSIISGMAMGIDAIAHKETIKQDGYTIGVLGTGIDMVYPKRNRELYDKMISCGTLVSEFPLGTPPNAYNFPQRNRIISGLSDGLIIVEAQEKSGTLITANHALEQGKDVFAIPGNINSIFSKGTNKLIKDGAIPLLEIEDIFNEIRSFKDLRYSKTNENLDYSEFSDSERRILETLKNEPKHIDNIVYETKMDISNINTLLIGLELKGVVEEVSSSVFMIC